MVKIIVDDAMFLDRTLLDELDIVLLRHGVYFDEEDVRDMDYKTFNDRLKKEKPSTSLLPQQMLENTYKNMDADEIISIHLSGGMSGTFNNAKKAAEKIKNKKIFVVNSLMTSSGEALLAMLLAKKAKEGMDFENLKNECNNIRNKINYFMILNDLQYLSRMGRLGKGKALIGNLMRIKPILIYNEEGKIIPFGKARTDMQVLNKIFTQDKQFDYILLNHAYYCNLQDNVIEDIKKKGKNVFILKQNNIITVFTGPNAWTIAFI